METDIKQERNYIADEAERDFVDWLTDLGHTRSQDTKFNRTVDFYWKIKVTLVDKRKIQQDMQLQLDELPMKVGALSSLPHQIQLLHSKLDVMVRVSGFIFRTNKQTSG